MNDNQDAPILPDNPDVAVSVLIRITRDLVTLSEKEASLLAQGDILAFSALQEDKEKLSRRYEKASQEFRARLEEFRGIGRVRLDQLEKLQNELSEKAQMNNVIIRQMAAQSLKKTQATLLSAQEIGQNGAAVNGNQSQSAGG